MGFSKYMIFGLLFLIGVATYVNSVVEGTYGLSVAGISVNLPIVAWVILPALVLYVFTALHIMFYGTLGFFRYRKIKKDSKKFIENTKRALLGRPIEDNKYKSEVFQLPGQVLPLLNIDPKRYSDYKVNDETIEDILKSKKKICDGDCVDLRKYNLRDDNALLLQNHANKLKEDKSYSSTILRKCTDDNLRRNAELAMAEYSPLKELLKHNVKIDLEIFNILLKRIKSDDNFSLTHDEIVGFISELDIDKNGFLELSKDIKGDFTPDQRVRFVEELMEKFPSQATDAYLYTMFDLQMIEEARDMLENSNKDEHIKFKHLLFLKDSGKNFDIDLFI